MYDVIKLDLEAPWKSNVLGGWLIRIEPDESVKIVNIGVLTVGAPEATDQCIGSFVEADLPWPPSPNALPPSLPCGSQRPGINVAPAIGEDGVIYTVTRAHFNSSYGYVVAVNPDLTPRWKASLRDRLNDGCGVLLPINGAPGGCRLGTTVGVDPATNRQPAARVEDFSSSSPIIAPDGSILYGAFTRYNYSRGHLMKFSASGEFVGSYDYGWDITPAVVGFLDGTYSVVIKDNHYGDIGSYCDSGDFCPIEVEKYSITSLTMSLVPAWSFDTGTAKEWCVSMPAVDREGTVYAHSEDGNLYAIDRSGALLGSIFLAESSAEAYTPLAIGANGRVYVQKTGDVFVVGADSFRDSKNHE